MSLDPSAPEREDSWPLKQPKTTLSADAMDTTTIPMAFSSYNMSSKEKHKSYPTSSATTPAIVINPTALSSPSQSTSPGGIPKSGASSVINTARHSFTTKFSFVNEKVSQSKMKSQKKSVEEQAVGETLPSLPRMLVQRRVEAGLKPKLWSEPKRPCPQHSFLSDPTDVAQMEKGLFTLLKEFHSGKLKAFGKDCSMEQMEGIREQQEKLARLHFDLGAQQDLYTPLSEEGLRLSNENMHRLMESLEQLSVCIEKLHTSSSSETE